MERAGHGGNTKGNERRDEQWRQVSPEKVANVTFPRSGSARAKKVTCATSLSPQRPRPRGCLFCFDKGEQLFPGQNRSRKLRGQTEWREIYWGLVGGRTPMRPLKLHRNSLFFSTWRGTLVVGTRNHKYVKTILSTRQILLLDQ